MISARRLALQLLGWVVLWRVALLIVAFVAPFILPFKPSFPLTELLQDLAIPHWLSAWANFDGVHYLTLISRGYLAVGYVQAFFPIWPLILMPIWWVSSDLTWVVLVGQLVALSCFAGALFLYRYLLARTDKIKSQPFKWLVVLLLLFPTSFHFAALYSESLFLLLVLGVFICAFHKKWWWAGILAGIASGTRVVGIFLVPALLIELAAQSQLWQSRNLSPTSLLAWIRAHVGHLSAISLGVVGLLGYSIFLWWYFADPLYFFHVQSEFGGGRQESLVLFPQVVWRYLKILTTVPLDLRYLIYLQEFLAGVGGLVILLLGFRKVRLSLWFFSLMAVLLPTLTGTFSSMPRYILVAPAIFLIINAWLANHPKLRIVWLIISTLLLLCNAVLFIQGYWVA